MILTIEKKTPTIINGAYDPSKNRALNTSHTSDIPMYKGKFITGLDKWSPSILQIRNEDDRNLAIEAKLKIRKDLEATLGVSLDQDTPDGREFFSNFVIDFNAISELDDSIPEDKLLKIIIEENYNDPTFPIAKNKAAYEGDVIAAKDYHITNREQDLANTVSAKVMLNKAKAELTSLYEKDVKKMRNIALILLSSDLMYDSNMTNETVYDLLDKYLNNEFNKTVGIPHKAVIENFFRIAGYDKKELDYNVTIEKAIKYYIIKQNSKGSYYNEANSSITIGSRDDVFAYYRDSANQAEYGLGKEDDLPTSIKAQIKQKENLK